MTQTEGHSARRIHQYKITNDEIVKAINSLARTKAPGPDGIGFRCIQQAYRGIPERMNQLYCTLGTMG